MIGIDTTFLTMDPVVGAVCTPPEIAQMVDDLLIAQAEWLLQYGTAIAAARERVRSDRGCRPVIGKGRRGPPVRSIEDLRQQQEAGPSPPRPS